MQAISVVLNLYQNDVVKVINAAGKLRDDSTNSYTHFTGYLLQQNVAFGAFRNSNWATTSTAMTYDGTYVNLGNGLDITTGIFSAPIAGMYVFHFNALCDHSESTTCYLNLRHNGADSAGSYRTIKVSFNVAN